MTPRRWALLALALVGAGVALVWQADDPPPVTKSTPDAAAAKPVVDTPAHCEAIRKAYATALAPLQQCDHDSECLAQPREGVLAGLDGCVRYLRADAGTVTTVDPIQATWLARGCARDFVTCAPRLAQCVQHACIERPPPGIAPGWKRYEHARWLHVGSGFSMFMPGEYGPVDRLVEDGEGGRFRGPRHELSYEFDEYAPFREAALDEGEVAIAREESVVNGRPALFQTVRTKEKKIFSTVYFELTPPDAGKRLALAIFAVCDTVEECAEVGTIGRTVEIELSTAY